MIDIESTVFDTVATAIRTAYSDASIYGEYVETPQSFPSISIVENDNMTAQPHKTIDRVEDYSDVVYTVNVYSNLANGKKAQAKAIADIVCAQFEGLGFDRTSRNQIPNLDRTIYRITMRFSGRVQKLPNDTFVVYGR